MKISKKQKIKNIISIIEHLEINWYIYSINQLEKMRNIDINNYSEIWNIIRRRRKFNCIEWYKNRLQLELRKKYKEEMEKLIKKNWFIYK